MQRDEGALKDIMNFEVQGGTRGRGRPKKTWMECVNNDIKTWSMPVNDIHNRLKWRQTIKESMRSSNLPVNGGQRK